MKTKLLFGVVLLFAIIFLLGCSNKAKESSELQLYSYPNVSLPTPDTATLFKSDSGASQKTAISKTDMGQLIKTLRTGLDTALSTEQASSDTWNNAQKFALELDYTKAAHFVLAINNSQTVNIERNKVLIDLDKKALLLQNNEKIYYFSGLALSDTFIKYLQLYTQEQGLPLPPAKPADTGIDQLPLAKPGGSTIELLPPAEPKRESIGH